MYRVMLKISEVGLRLKQNIQIQLAVKKHNQNFSLEHKSKLNKCIARFEAQTQFFITTKDPKFSIYVMIVCGEGRKLAGMLHINLINFLENSNNQIRDKLEQSPDSQAYIVFQFVYMTTGYLNSKKQLISTNQLQTNFQHQVAKQMQQRNDFLNTQNNRLDLQLEQLKKNNQNLNNNKDKMNDYYQKSLHDYKIKVEQKEEEINNSQINKKIMKEKIERARGLVQQYGDQNLKDRIQQIFKTSDIA